MFQVFTQDTYDILALKKIVVPRSRSGNEMENFRNEIDLLLKLRGKPHCIQMYEYEVAEDAEQNCFRINMLFECGEIDLNHLLKRQAGGSFADVMEVKPYWKQMLLAVHTVHSFRIVHGDLKPANFLMVKGVHSLSLSFCVHAHGAMARSALSVVCGSKTFSFWFSFCFMTPHVASFHFV